MRSATAAHIDTRFSPLAAATLAAGMLVLTATAAHGQQPLHGAIGAGTAIMPRYVGAEDYRTQPFPFIQLEYGDRAFAGVLPSGLGFGVGSHVVRNETFGLQVAVSQAMQRKEHYGDALAGMGDRDGAATAGAAMSLHAGFLTARSTVAMGLKKEVGNTGDFSIEASHGIGQRWTASVAGGATIADERNMQYEFGVSTAQAATRQALIDDGDTRLRDGDGAAYSPSAGLKQSVASASLAYAMTDRTKVLVFAQGMRLSDEAAASSLVRRRDGTSGGMAVVWGF